MEAYMPTNIVQEYVPTSKIQKKKFFYLMIYMPHNEYWSRTKMTVYGQLYTSRGYNQYIGMIVYHWL